MNINALKHQAEFLQDNSTRFIALIGGYGSGKTKSLCWKLVMLALLNPGHEGIALSPTFSMSTKNLIPTLEDALTDEFGYVQVASGNVLKRNQFSFNKSDLVFSINVQNQITKIHILAAETYKRAAGLNAAFFGVDEADLLDTDTFIAAWRMMSSRLRKGNVFQGVAVSTPEGFKGCYKFFVEEVNDKPELAKDRRLIRASTYDNPFLPKEFIKDLEAQYPPHLLNAYLNGHFVNLTGSLVYWRFDKTDNVTELTLNDFPNKVLHIGGDWNKGVNAAVISIIHNGRVYTVDEIYGCRDAQALADEIKKRYPDHVRANAIRFYFDSSGFEGLQTLQRNFQEHSHDGSKNFRQPAANPPVDKRVASVQEMFCDTRTRERMAFVNPAKCPNLMKGLTQQVYAGCA